MYQSWHYHEWDKLTTHPPDMLSAGCNSVSVVIVPKLESNNRQILDKPKLRDSKPTKWPAFFKHVKIIKTKKTGTIPG